MANAKPYTGSCHCGKVSYEITAELGQVIACNCSMCGRKGHLLTFVAPDQFKLLSGEGATTDYQFNTKNIHHLFCSTCGVSAYGWGTGRDGGKMYSINARCLEGVDPDALDVKKVDGKSF
jgi:hypothetical protein